MAGNLSDENLLDCEFIICQSEGQILMEFFRVQSFDFDGSINLIVQFIAWLSNQVQEILLFSK